MALDLLHSDVKRENITYLRNCISILFLITTIQIIYGAFVAGLNAGFIMNTWPKMGNDWIHESVTAINPLWLNFLDGIAGVQFIHRYLAYVVVGMVLFILLRGSKYELNKIQSKGLIGLLVVVFIQFILGIFTLLFSVPIWLGVTHQIGAFFLLGAVVYALSSFRNV